MKNNIRKSLKGFTLVEMLVVVVIIGILLAIILPNTLRAIEEANAKDSASNIRAIETAIQLCYASTRSWDSCNDIDTLVQDHYLENTPEDPFGIGYEIVPNPDGEGYIANRSDHFTRWPPRGFSDHVNFGG